MEINLKRNWLKGFKRLPERFAEASWRAIYEDLSISEFGPLIHKMEGLVKKFESLPSRIESDLLTAETMATIEKNFKTFVPSYYKIIPKTVKQPPTANPQNLNDYLKLALYVVAEDTVVDRYYERGQIDFLKLLIQVLKAHGISPSVNSRDDRFIVEYLYKYLRTTKTEFRHFPSLTDLEENVCKPFQNQKVMHINGSILQAKDLLKIRIYETKLDQDEVIFKLEGEQKRKLKPVEFNKIWQSESSCKIIQSFKQVLVYLM